MIVTAKDLEIRGKEKKISNKTNKEYLIVRVEDETGKSTELLDWNVENFDRYKRGTIIGKYINISIKDFTTTE